jgi:hypothetical protein
MRGSVAEADKRRVQLSDEPDRFPIAAGVEREDGRLMQPAPAGDRVAAEHHAADDECASDSRQNERYNDCDSRDGTDDGELVKRGERRTSLAVGANDLVVCERGDNECGVEPKDRIGASWRAPAP